MLQAPELVAIAPKDFAQPLIEELGSRILQSRERLYTVQGKAIPHWAQNVWLKPEVFSFQSISQAVRHLRDKQRNWHLHSTNHHRRARLIADQLPPIKSRTWDFPSRLPTAPLGAWTLWDEGTLLYSPLCTSPFADGEIEFNEDKAGPPSRAYLKLWEFFTLEQRMPKPGEKVLDLGSSPGGWTWVLDQLGCEVLSVDKAPLAENLKISPRVKFLAESAFALDPQKVGLVDWLFSDIICYPDRLLELVNKWQQAGTVKNFVCTIKFQGPTDPATVREFAEIPGAKIRHLSHNKHELTWSLLSNIE